MRGVQPITPGSSQLVKVLRGTLVPLPMNREDSKPAPAAPAAPAAPPLPKITRKVSLKNVSDSCLEQFAKCEVKEL